MSLPTTTLRRAIALTIVAASMSPLTAMASHASNKAATKHAPVPHPVQSHAAPVHQAPIHQAIQRSVGNSKSPIKSNTSINLPSKSSLPANIGIAGGLKKNSLPGQTGQQASQSLFSKFSKPVTSATNSTAATGTSSTASHPVNLSNAHSLSFGDILSAPTKAIGSVVSDAGSVVKTVGDGAAKAATGAVSAVGSAVGTVGNAVGSVVSGGGQKTSTPVKTGTTTSGPLKTGTGIFGGTNGTGGTGVTGSATGAPSKTTTPTPATTGTAATTPATTTTTPATTTTTPATTTTTPATTTATPAATTAGGGNGGGGFAGQFIGGGGLASVLANLPIGGGFGGGGGYAAPASYAPAPMDYSQQASYQQPVNQGGSVDLVLEDAKVVSPATRFAGPAIAVTYRNSGSMASPRFMVSVVASEDGQYRADAPRAAVEVPGLAAGQSRSVVVRMPRGDSKFVILSIDPNNSVNELNKDNNSAVVELSTL